MTLSSPSFPRRREAILITGAGRRVGAQMVRRLAERGYDIALHYNTNKAGAEEAQKAAQKAGAACELFSYDLADRASYAALIDAVFKRFPACRHLVNNASIFEKRSFMETRPEDFDAQMTINFKAPFFITQDFVRHCKNAVIVNLLDTAVSSNEISNFTYLLSKKALMHFTFMAANALGPDVRVNAVCPGIVLPLNEHDEDYMRRLSEKLPLREVAKVDEVVDAVQLLLETSSLTGQMLFIDGGERLLSKLTV